MQLQLSCDSRGWHARRKGTHIMKNRKVQMLLQAGLAMAVPALLPWAPVSSLVISTASTHLSPTAQSSTAHSASILPSAWKNLGAPHHIYPFGQTAAYYRWHLKNGNVANLVVVDLSKGQWRLRTVINGSLTNVAKTAQSYGASIAVNGGFFDTRNGDSVGYVIDQGDVVGGPHKAKNLIANHSLKTALPAIFNRSELREIVSRDGSRQLVVAPHGVPALGDGTTIEESLQAGPQLLPSYAPQKEGFIRRGKKGRLVDSISTSAPEARTAIGITSDGKLLLLTVANPAKGPDGAGLTLVQLSALLKSVGAVQALNLDGGSSTTMYLQLQDSTGHAHGTVVSGSRIARRVKSVLLLQPMPRTTDQQVAAAASAR